MQKKIITMLLILSMTALAGCGKGETEKQPAKDNHATVNEEVTADTTVEEDNVVVEDAVEDTNVENNAVADKETEKNDAAANKETEKNDAVANKETEKNDTVPDKRPEQDSGIVEPELDENRDSDSAVSEKDKNSENADKPENKEDSEVNGSEEKKLDYESFQALSPGEQQAYMESFDDIEAFFEWYNAAKEVYEEENPPIEINGGTIDLEEILGGDE